METGTPGIARVAIIMGSDSDWPVMEVCHRQLCEFGIRSRVEIMSAHRTPERVHEFSRRAEADGIRVIIAAAGMAAALPGSIAAGTTLPVIGVPLESGALMGIDSLLSMVQMPPGVPVATVAIGAAGARNAAVLAAQVLALNDPDLNDALKNFKRKQAESVDNKNQALRERLASV